MTVKVLVTALGQQIVADTKQIENKESNELVGYWMENPRVVAYQQNEEGGLAVNFAPYCMVSDEASFSIRAEHIVAILEPRQDVVDAYANLVAPPEAEAAATVEGTEETPVEEQVDDAAIPDTTEGLSDVSDSTDGAAGDGAESPSV